MSPRLETIAYVSRSRISEGDPAREIDAIVSASVLNNKARGVTGVLIFSGLHFLQVLEGTHDQLSSLVAKLSQDTRHEEIIVIAQHEISERRFPDWSMQYAGIAEFALAFFSRLHHGTTADADLAIVYALIDRIAA